MLWNQQTKSWASKLGIGTQTQMELEEKNAYISELEAQLESGEGGDILGMLPDKSSDAPRGHQ